MPTELNQESKNKIDEMVTSLLSQAPDILGIDEAISGCEVLDLDPYSTGTLPRYVEVRLRGGTAAAGGGVVNAFWRGNPVIAVGDDVVVAHYRDGDRYEITAIGGSGGSSPPSSFLLAVWVYDVSLGLLIPYTTITDALAYALLAAGDFVLIGPGTYDESFSQVSGVYICELVPGTVIITCTTANTAVTVVNGGYINVKEINVLRNEAALVYAVAGSGACDVIAEKITATNTSTNVAADARAVQCNGGDIDLQVPYISAAGGYDAMGISAGVGQVTIMESRIDVIATNGNSWGLYSTGGDIIAHNCRFDIDNTSGDAVGIGALSAGSYVEAHKCRFSVTSTSDDAYGIQCTNGTAAIEVLYCEFVVTGSGAGDDGFGIYATATTSLIVEHCRFFVTGFTLAYGLSFTNASPRLSYCTFDVNGSFGNAYGVYANGTGSVVALACEFDGVSLFANGYGAYVNAGTLTMIGGRATGSTTDLHHAAGTLNAFCVRHDSEAGTITHLDGVGLASLQDYAQGSVIYGGAADWEDLVHPGAANRVFQSTAAEVQWSTWALVGTAGQTYTFPAVGGTIPTGTGAANQVAYWSGANTITGAATFTYNPAASPNLFVQAANAAHIPLVVRGAVNQSANQQEWQDSAGNAYVYVGPGNGTASRVFDISGGSGATSTNTRPVLIAPFYVGAASGGAGVSISPQLRHTANVALLYGQLNIITLASTANNVTSVRGVQYRVDTAASFTGTYTNCLTLFIDNPSISGSSPVNNYGVYINSQTAGTALNYAIYTNTGIIHAGDKVEFTQTDGNEYIDSLADGYMDYGATTAHRFDSDVEIAGHWRQADCWHGYGGFEDQAETITCGVGDWNHITNAGNDLWNLDEGDGISEAADVFTIANTGDYVGTLSLSLSGLNGKDFHVRVYNNTQARVEGRPIGISTTGAGNEMNVCVPIYIEATAADAIQFEIMSADGTDPDVDDALFYLTYLHD